MAARTACQLHDMVHADNACWTAALGEVHAVMTRGAALISWLAH
jgi:hypothetical protein